MLSVKPKAEADNSFRISQKPHPIIVLLYIVLKKIMTNTLLQGT